jgi:hypothetical protein
VVEGVTKIGGDSGRDLTDLFESLKSDIDTLHNWTTEQFSELDRGYELFAARRGRLRRRIQKLMEVFQSRIFGNSFHEEVVRFDTTSSIDWGNSTVQYDATKGAILLPLAVGSSRAVDLSDASVVSQTIPVEGRVILGNPLSCLNLNSTEAWVVEVPPDQQCSAVLKLNSMVDTAGPSDDFRVNRIYLDPVLPSNVKVELSPDGHNWVEVVNVEKLSSPMEFNFNPILAGYLRIYLGPGTAGLKRLVLYEVDYSASADYYSTSFEVPFSDGLVRKASIELDADIPEGTNIESVLECNSSSGWIALSSVGGVYEIFRGDFDEKSFDGNNAEKFSAGGWLLSERFASPVDGVLYRGISQVEVGAMLDLEALTTPNQELVQAEPSRFDEAKAKFAAFDRNLDEVIIKDGVPLSGFCVEGNYKSPLITCVLSGLPGGSSIPSGDWFGIVLREYSPTNPASGQPILHPGYLYKFTFWVKPQIPAVYPGMVGAWMCSGDTSHCPVTILVNGRRIFSGKRACTLSTFATGLSDSERVIYWPLESEWNKVEIYVYRPGKIQGADVEGESLSKSTLMGASPEPVCGESPSGQVVFFRPNFFSDSSYQVVSDPVPMEFAPIWDVVLSDDEKGRMWTWVKRPDTSMPWQILLSSNPTSRRNQLGSIRIDGLHASDALKFKFRYFKVMDNNSQAKSLTFRVKLKFSGGNGRTPVVRGYRVRFFS